MRIAIIGTGNVGKALGSSFVRAGHDVTFAARDTEKAMAVARELGASAVSTPAAAAATAEVVILAVPYGTAAETVAIGIAPGAEGKVVVDVTNPARPDFSGLLTEGGPSAAENVARWLPRSRVAKAFNTTFATLQADPQALGRELDALFATDDDVARQTVAQLIHSIGFRPVHVGPLARARELEALAWLNIQLQVQYGGAWRTAVVLADVPPAALPTAVSSAAVGAAR